MNVKQALGVVFISAATAVGSMWGYNRFVDSGTYIYNPGDNNKIPANYAGFFEGRKAVVNPIDFEAASKAATPAVVHIKTTTKARKVTNNLPRNRDPFEDMFGDFFGPRMQIIPEQKASGSGVVISEDGYIVTNNHVVNGADDIKITLANKKTFKAIVVGTDPSSDLAVIKIDAKNLPFLIYGNSDDTKLGQWVLAIGYPLNLDVTVTAGIVSAKSRSININNRQSKTPVESFIQTDAAVNPGNSGGPLINTAGELIGINSAIASPTGSYAGYSYAIPINIVKKVVNDIIKFGTVQRAFLGISYAQEGLSDEEKTKAGIKDGDGIFVTDVVEGGAAKTAGIRKGDFVTKINGVTVTSGPEMVEQIARYKPSDKITITYTRDGKETTASAVLKNKINTESVVKSASVIDRLGATLENLDKKTAEAHELNGGVLVKKINPGGLLKTTRMEPGFVIIDIDGEEIKTVDELKAALEVAKGSSNVRLGGFYPGYEGMYAYPLNLSEGEE